MALRLRAAPRPLLPRGSSALVEPRRRPRALAGGRDLDRPARRRLARLRRALPARLRRARAVAACSSCSSALAAWGSSELFSAAGGVAPGRRDDRDGDGGERLLRDHPGALGADPREGGGPRARPRRRASEAKQRSVHNNYLTLPVLLDDARRPLPVRLRRRARVARARRADGCSGRGRGSSSTSATGAARTGGCPSPAPSRSSPSRSRRAATEAATAAAPPTPAPSRRGGGVRLRRLRRVPHARGRGRDRGRSGPTSTRRSRRAALVVQRVTNGQGVMPSFAGTPLGRTRSRPSPPTSRPRPGSRIAPMLEITAGGFDVRRAPRGGGGAGRPSPRSGGCCRSSRGSSTSAGRARPAGSRSATSTSASAPRTRRATRTRARSSSTRAASRRRRSCSPTATSTSPRRPASWRATTSRRSSRATSTSGRSGRSSSGRARRRSSSASRRPLRDGGRTHGARADHVSRTTSAPRPRAPLAALPARSLGVPRFAPRSRRFVQRRPPAPFLAADPDRRGYIFERDDGPVGFGLVGRATPGPMLMFEFFVVRAVRGQGVGGAAAEALFALHPGVWEIPFQEENARAAHFWRGVAARAARAGCARSGDRSRESRTSRTTSGSPSRSGARKCRERPSGSRDHPRSHG